jgi:hypothetical protein
MISVSKIIRVSIKSVFSIYWLWCAYISHNHVNNIVPILFCFAAVGIWAIGPRQDLKSEKEHD